MSQQPKAKDATDEGRLSIRVGKFKYRLDDALTTKPLVEQLYLDRDLSLEEFDTKMFEIGYQIAVRKLVQVASSGDTKAIDLLLKRHDVYKSKHRKVVETDDASPSPEYTPRVKSE